MTLNYKIEVEKVIRYARKRITWLFSTISGRASIASTALEALQS
jgi:hypothetical protein